MGCCARTLRAGRASCKRLDDPAPPVQRPVAGNLPAERLGWKYEGPWTTRRLLAALSKTPGELIAGKVRMPSDCCARGQWVLCFSLPESHI